MPTRIEVVNGALERAQIKAPDQTAAAADFSSVDQMLTDLHEELVSLDTVDWELTAIPVRASGPIKDELAFYIKDDFMLPSEIALRLSNRQVDARQTLYKQFEKSYDGENAETSYF